MYLKPKIENPEIQFEAMACIPDVNVYEYHPEKLLEKYQQKPAYFFTKRKTYANGKRPNRTVQGHGYWLMISKTVPVIAGNTEVGEKSGLVFLTGRRRDVEGHGHWQMNRKTEHVMAGNTEIFHTGGPKDDKSNTKTNRLMEEYHIPGSDWTLCWIYLFKHTSKT
ncbi:NAC transcription factor 29-like [Papaver somniferum]|uniref:NAC transcription factor 29-like n=1 Tax=Papaver somniferum TaxID=3469 RepID=UPI000E6F4A34|nr:NAC transcription factor 29-like [Papaver somniferum]